MKRRTFLQALSGLAVVGALGAALRRFWPGARPTPPARSATDAARLATLLAIVDTIIHQPIEQSHYAEYLSWRRAHLPAYRALYDRLAEDAEAASVAATGRAFPANDFATRERVLRPLVWVDMETLGKVDWNGRLEREPADPVERALRVHRYFVAEILSLFASTDAWVILGYEAWDGTPLGADYRKPPVKG